MHESRPLLAYFISWTCYGQWLHGDPRGSIDFQHNQFGEAFVPWDEDRRCEAEEKMSQEPYSMDEPRRQAVLEGIRFVCHERGWTLHAVHVRKYHVHVVVKADKNVEQVLIDLKAYASRALNENGFDGKNRKRWTKHGSTKYIYDPDYLNATINYTLNKQGKVMQRWPE